MSRLRVAVPTAAPPSASGHGRVWGSALQHLARDVRFVRRRAQVHLVDGHGPFLDVTGPVVAVVHEASWDDPGTQQGVSAPFLAGLRERTTAWVQRADRVLVPSAWGAQQVLALGGRPVVAPYGVDSETFRPGGEREPGTVLFVGTFQPRKNLTGLRLALAQLDRPVRLLLVAGGAADRADSRDLEAQGTAPLDNVEVVRCEAPDDAALAALMRRASVLCLPSLAEGFGLPVLEAMSCGTPVVVSDRGALPEVVGAGGVVVPLEGDDLGRALGRVLGDPQYAAELGARGRTRALELSWEHTAEGWREALLLARGN